MGCRLLVGESRDRTHEALAVVAHLATVLIHEHDESVALSHGIGHTLAQALVVLVVDLEFVDHHLDVVVLVAVETHAMHHLAHLTIDTHIEEALAAHLLEELAVVSLTSLDEWSENKDGTALIIIQYEINYLLLGILDHLLARSVGVGLTGTGKEQAQVVVHLGDGAHGGAGILIGGLLLYGNHGRESSDLVYIGTLHATEEVAGIGREGLYIATLTLGKEGIERQGGFTATAQTGNHRERAVRDGGIDILQVMLAGSVDFDATLTPPKGG